MTTPTKTATHTPGAIKAARLMAISPKVRQLALGIILREEFVDELAGYIDRETAAPILRVALDAVEYALTKGSGMITRDSAEHLLLKAAIEKSWGGQ